MSANKQVMIRDLVEEAKKRTVFLAICVVGLSYLMSLTSSSVWVNLPVAASLIIVLRYLSLDYEMRRKAAAYNNQPSKASSLSQKKHLSSFKVVDRPDWRIKVNSPVVEDAIDHFTRHLVSEWVTDLWYSRITPDKEGPEELVQIINGVLGEMSFRMRNLNLIDFLTRDIVSIICTHLEIFRATQTKIRKKQLTPLTIDNQDTELKVVLAEENKLHPALFSPDAEHKVLQHLMVGLISFTFKPEDLQCSFFRYSVRELLACAVMRPILNLASPRFINERIESVVLSRMKANKGDIASEETSNSKSNGSPSISSDHFSRFIDPSVTGVELVQLKNCQSRNAATTKSKDSANGMHQAKDPLLSMDAQSTRSWSSLPQDSKMGEAQGIQRHLSGGEWGDVLDAMSRRKTQALAPENFENMWTKGRNYQKNDGGNKSTVQVPRSSSGGKSDKADQSNIKTKQVQNDGMTKGNLSKIRTTPPHHPVHNSISRIDENLPNYSSVTKYKEDEENDLMYVEETESGTSSSYTTEDEEITSITGLDTPSVKVWDGRNNRNPAPSRIHHPLESSEGHMTRKPRHVRFQRLSRSQSGRKRSRLSGHKLPVWQEVERTSFLSGDGQDILKPTSHKIEESSDDSDMEMLGRTYSGAAASSSAHSISPGSHSLEVSPRENLVLAESFFKLRCEVLGANIVKSGSRTFAVYSISVTDVNNNCWSIKRRFRHFEELHRRLKEFSEYNLHLPPKHFLSGGLDVSVIRERCKLLDNYMKKLLQLPSVSGSIEVWDFLSVDSQTYIFSNSISIIETLSVDMDEKPSDKIAKATVPVGSGNYNSYSVKREHPSNESRGSTVSTVADGTKMDAKGTIHSPFSTPGKEHEKKFEDRCSDLKTISPKNPVRNLEKNMKGREGGVPHEASRSISDAAIDPTVPSEWIPPNLSVPIFDMVDVIFQLQDGGWIRRKAFWVAKQVLQLGMGDAFDDWLIEKIQLLRKGSVIASGVSRVEQILWPDGIFLTKHPKRQRPLAAMSPSQSPTVGRSPTQVSSPKPEDVQKFEEEQKREADRRAKLVYELMIDKAPAAIVGLVGRKEYEQCAKDLYYFLQSAVCMKQLAFDILEVLLLTAFPELDNVLKEIHEEKHKFGEFKPN